MDDILLKNETNVMHKIQCIMRILLIDKNNSDVSKWPQIYI